ncbi:RNA polymerase II-associated protein 3 [Coccinella septempunctata]|uniref:RNA polymerase II-associated protein 3 n=1 Tax=Coccinella septempunctata TaxID=41139 RepID=UPI001D069D36|nr:RNA polymerase II-associated protein 3 [Coccinella septempunctata]
MDPLLLQQQLKNNNQDFLDFYKDLQSWGKEMEKKEQERKPQKQEQSYKMEPKIKEIKQHKVEEINKGQKEILNVKKVVKKKCMSYADWDKFDVDKECEKVDEDSASSTESLVEDLKEQANIEKAQGNKFVKSAKWDDAIRSYTNAIKYYAYDPIFYANRALCFLKTERMEKAEQDCNIAIKLDNTYVKAYQRRSAAREALNKLEDARLDLLRVLELEPKNSESRKKLEELVQKIKDGPQKPISKFCQSRQHLRSRSSEIQNEEISRKINSIKTDIDTNKPKCIWPSGDVDNIVKAVQKPPHMRSTKPLKRIPIQEINSAITESSDLPERNENPKKFSLKTDDIKIVEHKNNQSSQIKQVDEDVTKQEKVVEDVTKQEMVVDDEPQLTAPKTSVQFHATWKKLRGRDDKRGEYLRLVNPKKIPDLFKDSLESDVFSEILYVLAEHLAKEKDETYEYLLHLSKIKRFSALSMFLTLNDKNSLWKMFNHMKEYEGRSKEEIDNLISKYEL